jgi:hypothetical protein
MSEFLIREFGFGDGLCSWPSLAGCHWMLEESARLWNRLAEGELIGAHRRLLDRLRAMVNDQVEIYDVTDTERAPSARY